MQYNIFISPLPPVIPQNFHIFLFFHQLLISYFMCRWTAPPPPKTFNNPQKINNDDSHIIRTMNGTPCCRQLQCSDSYRREGISSSRTSAYMNANPSNHAKILSLSTSTIPFIISHPVKRKLSLPLEQSDLLDILKYRTVKISVLF